MPATLNEFIRALCESGLMADGDVRAFLGSIPAERRPTDAAELARELFRQKKLTKYQAQALYHGRGRGLVLGNYVILERLGQGGMAQVFSAQHVRMQRTVAIKVLPLEMIRSPESVRRFQIEVQAAARLSHPNIVTAYDADEALGIHFLVMECVEGENLAVLVREHGAFPVQKALACVLQASQGLEYAHQQGIIHRDIKPSNLLLDRKGVIKILDMGLARVEASIHAGGGADDFESGNVVGTVDYMSPEQSYDMRSTDQRADIYSLGCTLHFLLTGHTMYPGDTMVQKVLAHRERRIPSLRKDCTECPEGLDAVFEKMVAKRAKDRHQSMTEVIADLQTFVVPGALKGEGPLVGRTAYDDFARGQERFEDALALPPVPSLLDQIDLQEPPREAQPPPTPFTRSLRARAQRRLLLTAIAMAGTAIVTALIFGVLLRPARLADGMLIVELSEPDCTIEVLDGQNQVRASRRGSGNVSLLVDPGGQRVRVKKPGFRPFTRDFVITAGQRLRIPAILEREP